ncbi:MAG: DMT family transporter [Burkholderiales bacterium]|nr:DMT family transporter [Burkholderiales bacterium]
MLILDTAFFFAMGAALSYAVADIGLRFGMLHTNPFVGATITPFFGILTLAALMAATGARFPPFGEHYLWLAVAGIFNPGLFIILFMFGIAKIGVARAAPIKGSSPLLALVLAVIFLGEQPEWYHLTGVLLVVTGIVIISSGRTEGRWRRIDACWPLAAAASSAVGAIFWRKALPMFPDAIAGALVGLVAAFVLTLAYALAVMPERIAGGIQKAWKPLLIVGVVAAIGQYFFAGALQRGEVYRMVALIQASPLFTVAFALLFLRHAEAITWRVPAGALLTVSGAVLVNLRLAG